MAELVHNFGFPSSPWQTSFVLTANLLVTTKMSLLEDGSVDAAAAKSTASIVSDEFEDALDNDGGRCSVPLITFCPHRTLLSTHLVPMAKFCQPLQLRWGLDDFEYIGILRTSHHSNSGVLLTDLQVDLGSSFLSLNFLFMSLRMPLATIVVKLNVLEDSSDDVNLVHSVDKTFCDNRMSRRHRYLRQITHGCLGNSSC